MSTAQSASTVDPEEIARFDQISQQWWDPHGKFRPLHAMNPLRVGYIRDQIQSYDLTSRAKLDPRPSPASGPLSGLHIADIGCGGGLLSEPLARMGAKVTGVDASEQAIDVARRHADKQALEIEYRHTTVEALARDHAGSFDAVTCLEIVEHVADVNGFVQSVADLLKPGGLAFFSTLNRTAKSFATAIVGAEYMLGLLPRGTHDWRRFLRPEELEDVLKLAGLDCKNVSGMTYSPLSGNWALSQRRLAINYILAAQKPAV